MEHFENVVKKINRIAQVHIIVSSSWRLKKTVEELKEIFSIYNFSKYIVDKTSDEKAPFESWKNYCIMPHFDINNGIPPEILEKLEKTDSFEEFIESIAHIGLRCRASEINQWINTHPGYLGYVVIDDDEETHLSQNFGERFVSTYHEGKFIFNGQDADKAYSCFEKLLQDRQRSKT